MGLGIKPMSQPSFTSRPIHQSLSNFSCAIAGMRCDQKTDYARLEEVAQCAARANGWRNALTLMCRKSLHSNETAFPCTGASSSIRPSYDTFVRTAKATGLFCAVVAVAVTWVVDISGTGKRLLCDSIKLMDVAMESDQTF